MKVVIRLYGALRRHRSSSAPGVNDAAVESSAELKEGDRVSLFPPSAGGETTARGRLSHFRPEISVFDAAISSH